MRCHYFKFFMFLLPCTCLILLMGIQPAHAKKSFFEAMFGWMDDEPEGPDPAETLIAPFADSNNPKSVQSLADGKAGTTVPLKHAHTTEGEIGKWLVTAVSDAMSYEMGKPADVTKAHSKYFAQSGLRQFQEFLVQNNIQKVIDSERFNVRSFVKEDPLLLNSGVANDRFRWLYEVPIMVSYMDSENFNYKEHDPVNQHIVLTIQVGRFAETNDSKNNFNVLIETWSGKSQKIDKE